MARRHTELIEAIHRAAPIQSFSPVDVHWSGTDGVESQIPQVVGLTAAMRQAFTTQASLAQSGFNPRLAASR